jgi:hypothetical protein
MFLAQLCIKYGSYAFGNIHPWPIYPFAHDACGLYTRVTLLAILQAALSFSFQGPAYGGGDDATAPAIDEHPDNHDDDEHDEGAHGKGLDASDLPELAERVRAVRPGTMCGLKCVAMRQNWWQQFTGFAVHCGRNRIGYLAGLNTPDVTFALDSRCHATV